MKNCPNCGYSCADDAVFCTECGFAFPKESTASAGISPAPVTQELQHTPQQAPAYAAGSMYAYDNAPKKKSRLPFIIAGAVAGAALLTGVIVLIVRLLGGGVANDDFLGIQRKFLEDRFGAVETGTFQTLSSDLTLSAEVSGRGESASALSALLDGTSIVLKTDIDRGKVLFDAILNLNGSNILEGYLGMDNEEIRFAIPTVDDNVYVADASEFLESLGVMQGTAQSLGLTTEQFEEAEKNLDTVMDRYILLFGGYIVRDLEIERGKEVVLESLGDRVRGTLLTWEPTAEAAQEMIEDFADTIETDKELADLIDIVMLAMEDAEYYRYMLGEDGEAILHSASSAIYRNAYDIADQLEQSGFRWQVLVDNKGHVGMIRIEIEEIDLVVCYERYSEGDRVDETLYAERGRGGVFTIDNEYTVKGSERKGKLSVNTPDGRIGLDYDVDISKKSPIFSIFYGTYTLDARNLGLPGIELDVTQGADGSVDHILTVSRLDALTADTFSDVTLTLNASAECTLTVPSGPETDITGYDSYERSELIGELMLSVGQYLSDTPQIRDLLDLFRMY
ncbi:MAG: zinc ribbon domain-containing protein [Lachnospiraceae bacterium]|nr:zinc ribbon domain-containing protein [Lachnospiraceae bacterium]